MKNLSRLFLVTIAAVTIFFASGMPTEMTPVLEGNLPDKHPAVVEDSVLSANFENFEFAVIGLECLPPENVYTPRCINRVRALEERVERSPILARGAVVYSLPGYDYIENDEEGVLNVSDLIKEVPATVAEQEALRAKIENDELLFGKLVSKNGHASLMVFRIDTSLSQNMVFDELEQLADSYTGASVFKAGPYANHYQNRWFEILAQREIGVLGAAALFLLVIMMTSVLGWRAVPCMIIAIGISYVWALGSLGYLGFRQNVLTSSLPVLLVAMVSSHGYHILEEMRRAYKKDGNFEQAVRSPFSRVAWPVFGAGLTSTMGFVSLVSVPIVALRDFGLFAIVGIMTGAFASIFMIPAIVYGIWPSVITTPETKRSCFMRDRVERLLSFSTSVTHSRRGRIRVIAGAVALVFVASFGIAQIDIDSKPPHFIPKGEKARDGFDILEKHFGGTAFTHIVLDCGADGVESPLCLRKAEDVASFAEDLPDVTFATGLHDRVGRLHREMVNEGFKYESIPDDEMLVSQLMFIDNQDVLAELKSYDGRYLVVNLFIYAFNADRINAIRKALEEYRETHNLNGVMYFAGEFFIWSAMIMALGTAWVKSNALLLGLLVGVSWGILRSFRLAVLGLVPVSFANLLVFGLMGFLGVSVDIANFAITLIVGATAIDFYIHLASRARWIVEAGGISHAMSGSIKEVGVPIVFDCCTNLSFIVLVGSAFVPIQTLGIFLSIAMVAALAGTLFLVPAIICFSPSKFFGREVKIYRERSLKLYKHEAV